MELHIHGRNMELNEETRDYITRKVNRLSRHLTGITSATVELVRENTKAQNTRIAAQITLDIRGTVLRGEERGANAKVAIDSVVHVMDRRVERYKGKAYRTNQVKKTGRNLSLRNAGASTESAEVTETDEETLQAEGKVVRVKRYPIKPMTVDEAAFQMQLVGHDFFLFLNSETDQHNLLYKRHDGDFGLIQPEPL